jgi:hypothetical protein
MFQHFKMPSSGINHDPAEIGAHCRRNQRWMEAAYCSRWRYGQDIFITYSFPTCTSILRCMYSACLIINGNSVPTYRQEIVSFIITDLLMLFREITAVFWRILRNTPCTKSIFSVYQVVHTFTTGLSTVTIVTEQIQTFLYTHATDERHLRLRVFGLTFPRVWRIYSFRLYKQPHLGDKSSQTHIFESHDSLLYVSEICLLYIWRNYPGFPKIFCDSFFLPFRNRNPTTAFSDHFFLTQHM